MRFLITHFTLSFVLIGSTGIVSGQGDPPPWEYAGLSGVPITRLMASEQIGAGGGWLFSISAEGFHYFDEEADAWISRVEPGVPGREVRSIYAHTWNPGWLIVGRVDAEGQGYIERTVDLGESFTPVYQTTAGAVTDIDGGGYYDYKLWACTAAGESLGELLLSEDDGATWSPITGHGHTSLTDVFCWGPDQVFVAGDNGLVVTHDAGATWQAVSLELPAGPVQHLNHLGPAVAVVGDRNRTQDISLFATTGAGLYYTPDAGDTWTLALADLCLSVSLQLLPNPDRVLTVTQDGHILLDENFVWEWEDLTAELGPLTPVSGVIIVEKVFVATSHNGVYVASYNPPSDVPESLVPLHLTAAPTPFNPSTVLSFEATHASHAELSVYDMAGRLVVTLIEGPISSGYHSIPWQPRDVASGVYLARLVLGDRTATTRIVLAK